MPIEESESRRRPTTRLNASSVLSAGTIVAPSARIDADHPGHSSGGKPNRRPTKVPPSCPSGIVTIRDSMIEMPSASTRRTDSTTTSVSAELVRVSSPKVSEPSDATGAHNSPRSLGRESGPSELTPAQDTTTRRTAMAGLTGRASGNITESKQVALGRPLATAPCACR